MTFISAYHDKYRDKVLVWERAKGEARRLRTYDAPYYFYVPDHEGKFTALTGEKLSKLVFSDRRAFEEAAIAYPHRFESDFQPLERVLMDRYYGQEPPQLALGMVDIEVDYNPDVGYADPENPYAPISSLTLYRSDQHRLFTLAVPSKEWNGQGLHDRDFQDPELLKNGVVLTENLAKDITLVKSEFELLELFLRLIEDVDVLIGWNSEFFDVPYLGKRISAVLGPSQLRRLEFEGCPNEPSWGEVEKFGAKELVLNLHSRPAIDYLRMFRKFNLEGRDSFALDVIGEDEVGMPKLKYPGSLHQHYHQDFIGFLLYNRHDIKIIMALEQKFKYLELANRMIHEATVNFDAVFGSVKLIDTAIINYAHVKKQRILFDRKSIPKVLVEGALVMTPKPGMKKMVVSCDLESLYPSVYRSLNLSPEKIVGQFAGFEEDWKKIYKYRQLGESGDEQVTCLLESGDTITASVAEFVQLFKDQKYAVSGYGTVLDQSSGEGLVAEVLSVWFQGRKDMKKLKGKHAAEAKALLKANGGNKEDPAYKAAIERSEYYDLQQGIRKVLLNSTYGATLNEYCRFHDPRLGASTTGTGRQITTHMIDKIAELCIGPDAPKVKKSVNPVKPKTLRSGSSTDDNPRGDSTALGAGFENTYEIDSPDGLGPIYSDTDSCYFSVAQLVGEDSNLAVEVADEIVKQLNDSFPEFMRTAFLCQPEFSDRIKANREVVADRGILQAKKKYMFHVVNMEGEPVAEGDKKELKTQGSDIKLTSTPRVVRAFLKEVVLMILRGRPQFEVEQHILKFRGQLTKNPDVDLLEYANVTSVKNLELYTAQWEATEKVGRGKVTLPNNVRSSINHNQLLKVFNDKDTQAIRSGSKIKILWLKPNDYKLESIAFASETETLPKWFVDNFQVDVAKTEAKLIDGKLKNFFNALGWDIPTEHSMAVRAVLQFD